MIVLDIFQTNATSNRIHYKEEKVIKRRKKNMVK